MRQARFVFCLAASLAGPALAQGAAPSLSRVAPEGLEVNPGPIILGGGCPCASGTPEGEANCGLPTDTVNGGCNSVPEVTSPIGLNAPVCGTAAYDLTTRDTDWYEYTVTQAGTFSWRVEAEFPAALFVLDNLCAPVTILGQDTTTGCGDVGEVLLALAPGTYRFFVAPEFTSPAVACGTEYTATLGGGTSILAIPTVSTVGLAIIALALGGLAIFRLRRRTA